MAKENVQSANKTQTYDYKKESKTLIDGLGILVKWFVRFSIAVFNALVKLGKAFTKFSMNLFESLIGDKKRKKK